MRALRSWLHTAIAARHADRCEFCRAVWLSRGPAWLLCANGRHLLAVAWAAGKGAGR